MLLVGCGSENHSYGWDYDYKYEGMRVRGPSHITPEEMYASYLKAVQCLGDKPPPFIIFTTEINEDDDELKRGGQTLYGPPLILIKYQFSNDIHPLEHELVHYFDVRGHGDDFKAALHCVSQYGEY